MMHILLDLFSCFFSYHNIYIHTISLLPTYFLTLLHSNKMKKPTQSPTSKPKTPNPTPAKKTSNPTLAKKTSNPTLAKTFKPTTAKAVKKQTNANLFD